MVFELSEEDKNSRLDEFIDIVCTTCDNNELIDFICEYRNDFFANKISSTYHKNGRKIPKGMKITKAFKYFEEDAEVVNLLQTQASMMLQENKVEGFLYFSVHPLDFLSSSENTYNWRSCHALDGEYRAGNLSYMVDKSTVICYLCNTEHTILPNFPKEVPWNSKKWRMLLFFEEKWQALFAGRQYPFFSHTALDVVLSSANKFLPGHWTKWHNDQLLTFNYLEPDSYADGHLAAKYVCINSNLYSLTTIVKDAKHSLHFNDLLNSSCYTPYYTWKWYSDINIPPKFEIGGEVPCLQCGHSFITCGDVMRCLDCELQYGEGENDTFCYCDCCDRRMLVETGHQIATHSHILCDWCYNEYAQRCGCCGSSEYSTDLIYNKSLHAYVCIYCNRFNQLFNFNTT